MSGGKLRCEGLSAQGPGTLPAALFFGSIAPAMPLLRVRCTKCSRLISTGFDVDYDTFQALTDTERTVECPHCSLAQTWTLDDVDRSVFKK